MTYLILFLGILLDRITKVWAINTLKGGNDIVVIKNIFAFSYLENKGAAFGILQNKTIFLALTTLIVVSGMIFYLFKFKPQSKILKLSISFIIAGAVGNLVDRFYYTYVVDFIQLHYKDVYYFPTFNIADMLVVFGTIILGLCIVKDVK
ncbi:signal peptidase II [Desnuesiella massiliensis]|uniref:signal peptidase II n=1 Tax=Desnuesiella massiliensis TaxID=1650662 RepID=UPI0006E45000|nr:signal peptidase II [Desnuesiella massiliensis]